MAPGNRRLLQVFGTPLLVLGFTAGCDEELPSETSFYGERIGPRLEFGCVEQTAGCHLSSDRGDATGNLDLSTFEALKTREDALVPYGPYPVGLLLLKAGGDRNIRVETFESGEDRFVDITTDIRHNAGSTVALDAADYNEIRRWVDQGATETGVPPEALTTSEGPCRNGLPPKLYGFDAGALPGDEQGFTEFASQVQPVLAESCAGGQCHGSVQADLYLTCGSDDQEVRWNYFIATQFLTEQVVTSGLLRRPLSTQRGGVFHEGGNVFASADDPRYQTIKNWAEALVMRDPTVVERTETDPGILYFAKRVQPVMVRKGCMFLGCHSPSMGHDLRLRGGAAGVFSRVATLHNYEIASLMMAFESPDPNDSRLISKNLFPHAQVPGGHGVVHRGGALFEDFADRTGPLPARFPTSCRDDMGNPYDLEDGDLNEVPAYCIMARWHELERQERGLTGDPLPGIVYVDRPLGTGSPLDFDTFRGGADLVFADATQAADGAITLGATRSLLGGCGLPAGADVRTPAVNFAGDRIAFAARGTAAEPLRLYEVNPDGTNCGPVAGVAASSASENGILTHDFDPSYAPDGQLVFASSRGNLDRARYTYQGPTRTPASFAPNANIYVREGATLRQLTFLLNQEVNPNFMADGRLIMSTEKREPEFHMIAGRRQNLDGGDYHPLFAQRESLGFRVANEIVELANRNFAVVASGLDAVDGAGSIAIINRSIGPDQNDRDPTDRFFLSALEFPAPGAFGGTTGAFRSPAALPGGRVLTSCDMSAASLTAGPFEYDLCELDPRTGAVRVLGGASGRAEVEAVAVYPRVDHGIQPSRSDEPNGASRIEGGTDAEVHIQDIGLLATLMFRNTRTGNLLTPGAAGVTVFEVLPPPATATGFADVGSQAVTDAFGQVFVNYRSLGSVSAFADNSLKFRIPGGTPVVLRVDDGGGTPLTFPADNPLFTGELIQREQNQFYPGERLNQSFPRDLFNGVCGTCHGSVSGRELDVAVDVDILTRASATMARDQNAVDLTP